MKTHADMTVVQNIDFAVVRFGQVAIGRRKHAKSEQEHRPHHCMKHCHAAGRRVRWVVRGSGPRASPHPRYRRLRRGGADRRGCGLGPRGLPNSTFVMQTCSKTFSKTAS